MPSFITNLVGYIVQRVREEEGSLTKTKLVKLLYLIDVENYRSVGSTLTGWQWQFHHYGPYAFEIEDALRAMPIGFDEHEVITTTGKQAFVYRSDASLNSLEESFDFGTRAMIDGVLRVWASDSLNKILDFVYYETEPMNGAHRGDTLDFSKIEIARSSSSFQPRRKRPPPVSKQLKARFQTIIEARQRAVAPHITPPPFDEVYYDGLKMMDREDAA